MTSLIGGARCYQKTFSAPPKVNDCYCYQSPSTGTKTIPIRHSLLLLIAYHCNHDLY